MTPSYPKASSTFPQALQMHRLVPEAHEMTLKQELLEESMLDDREEENEISIKQQPEDLGFG